MTQLAQVWQLVSVTQLACITRWLEITQLAQMGQSVQMTQLALMTKWSEISWASCVFWWHEPLIPVATFGPVLWFQTIWWYEPVETFKPVATFGPVEGFQTKWWYNSVVSCEPVAPFGPVVIWDHLVIWARCVTENYFFIWALIFETICWCEPIAAFRQGVWCGLLGHLTLLCHFPLWVICVVSVGLTIWVIWVSHTRYRYFISFLLIYQMSTIDWHRETKKIFQKRSQLLLITFTEHGISNHLTLSNLWSTFFKTS